MSHAPAASHPALLVTVDVVLLTLRDGQLLTALVRRTREPQLGAWTLPGGFVHPQTDENALAAAQRILRDKAGLVSPYLEQLYTFADAQRDSRGWSLSMAHYALVPFDAVEQHTHENLKWVAVDDIHTLPFDHLRILQMAVSRVRSKTLYSSLPVHLMPPRFTLTELQKVYEALLGSALDKRSFRRRIEELDIVEEIPGALSEGGAHRPAQLYRRRRKKQLAVADSNLGVKP
jgi:8-oxo-dGTP diphosphatase